MTAVERVYLDTNVFIMLSEKDHRLQQLLVRMISSQPSEKAAEFATSELTLSELLVKPYQAGDDTLINGYESLILNSEWLDVRPVDRAVLYYAAALRAQYRHLKLPDAIHVSSAIGKIAHISCLMIMASKIATISYTDEMGSVALHPPSPSSAPTNHAHLPDRKPVRMTEPLLSVRDLSVAFHQGARESLAVDSISFEVGRGEIVALVGESGSGKSVSAASILKLLPYPAASHPSGQILFDGRDLMTASEPELRAVRGNDITMIFQEPMTSLNPLHTIERQIGEILALHQGLEGAPARARVLELLHQVGIREPEKRLTAFPHELSGGQRQRVMIAMALANRPKLLIADEPTTALDVTVQAQILELLGRLKSEHGMSMLFITHDLGIVRKFADRVCVMTKGKIVEAEPLKTSSNGHSTPTRGSCSPPSRAANHPCWTRRNRSSCRAKTSVSGSRSRPASCVAP